MSKGRKNKGLRVGEGGGINMTPMIDIVFQMIIFFVLTIEMERDALDDRIRLAMAPDGPAVERRDPRTVTIDVSDRGRVSLARVPVSHDQLLAIMRNSVARYGQTTPVVIRGDIDTPHEHIRRVMDTCTRAGLFRIKFAAIKEAN